MGPTYRRFVFPEESDPFLGVICGAAMNVANSAAGDGLEAVRVVGSDSVEAGGCA